MKPKFPQWVDAAASYSPIRSRAVHAWSFIADATSSVMICAPAVERQPERSAAESGVETQARAGEDGADDRPKRKRKLGSLCGKQGEHSLPGAAESTSVPLDALPRIPFSQLPDHPPETVSLSALDYLERR